MSVQKKKKNKKTEVKYIYQLTSKPNSETQNKLNLEFNSKSSLSIKRNSCPMSTSKAPIVELCNRNQLNINMYSLIWIFSFHT